MSETENDDKTILNVVNTSKAGLMELKENLLMKKESQVYLSSKVQNINEYLRRRKRIVEYIEMVAKKFRLRNETFFKTVQVLDLYINKMLSKAVVKDENDKAKLLSLTKTDELRLTAVLCLNVACKLEEINCNYLAFFKEQLIDRYAEANTNSHSYSRQLSLKDLVKKETEILKVINFRVNLSHFYDFNNIFMQLAVNEIDTLYGNSTSSASGPNIHYLLSELHKSNDLITKCYSALSEYVFISQYSAGIICFKASLIFLSYMMSGDSSDTSSNSSDSTGDSSNVYSSFLEKLYELINNKIQLIIPDAEYLKKIEVEAFFIFSKITNYK